MKNLLAIGLLLISVQTVIAQKIDTIYYDANWKGVANKDLAYFIRIASKAANDSHNSTFKDFYITGEHQTDEVIAIYIDKIDDAKSKVKGHISSYYKSGQKQYECTKNDSCQLEGEATSYYENGILKSKDLYKNGLLQELTIWNENGVKIRFLKGPLVNGKFEGELTEFYENGLRKNKGIIKDGKFIGTFYQFNLDGSYCEIEYKDGQPKKDYILVGLNGKRTKMKLNQ